MLVFLLASGATIATAQQTTSEDVISLDPFTVKANPDNPYIADESHTGTIIAVPRVQIPFTTSVVTGEMLGDAGVRSAEDISEFIAGVSRNSSPSVADESGMPSLQYRVRGFVNSPLYNGFQTGGRILSTYNLGRVEVSKGPNAVLYGQAPAGGVVNFIPKDPKFSPHATLSTGFGTKNYRQAAVDFGGPLGLATASGQAAVRLGASYQEFDREQVFFHSEESTLFGGVTWRPSGKVSVDVRGEYVKQAIVPSRTAAFVSLGAGPARVVDPYNRLRKDRNFTYNGPHSLNHQDNFLTTAFVTWRATPALTVRVGAFASEKKQDSLIFSGVFGLSVVETATTGFYQRLLRDDTTTALKADVLYTASLGRFKIDSLLGFESHWEHGDGQTTRTPSNLVVTIPFSRPPRASDFPAPPAASAFTVQADNARDSLAWTNARFTQFIKSPEERLTLLWGVARGEGDTKVTDYLRNGRSVAAGEKTTTTAGFTARVFEPASGALDQVVLFGNYSTSFNIQRGNAQNPADFTGFTTVEALRAFVATVQPRAIAPQEGDGFETGFRTQWFDGKLGFTALYFDQTNKNIARNFFVRESNVVGIGSETVIATFQLAGGQENARGVELAADWRPAGGLTLTAAAQFTNGRVEENPEAPEEIGFGLVSSPENMVSLWTRYDFPQEGRLSGLGLGFGLSYNSSTRIRPEIGDRYRLSDDYTRARALVRYAFKRGRAGHAFALNIDNLFDSEYTEEGNFLSEPTRYRLSYEVSF